MTNKTSGTNMAADLLCYHLAENKLRFLLFNLMNKQLFYSFYTFF